MTHINLMIKKTFLLFAMLLASAVSASQGYPCDEYHCGEYTNDGCFYQATYQGFNDTTSWSMDCNDGFFHEGTLAGNQVPALFPQVAPSR